jgi:3-oxoacyl-[acyl-carrier-protein] synthase-3
MIQRPLVYIAGLGVAIPDRVVTNADFEKTLDTSDQWIVERTGIRERRFAGPDETVSTMGKGRCGEGALPSRDHGIRVGRHHRRDRDPGQSVAFHCLPDSGFVGSRARRHLRHRRRLFRVHLRSDHRGGTDSHGLGERILVVGGEKLTSITDALDRSTAILFGDGAGAAVVQRTSGGDRGILSTFIRSDGRLKLLLHIPGGGTVDPISEKVVRERSHYMKMAGREVFKHAVTEMAEACDVALTRAGITGEQLDLLVPHQANIRIIEATAKHAGLPMSKVMVNVDRYGNTSSASIPLALAQAEEEGRLKPGMLVMLVAFGAGFTWGSAVIRW